MEKNIIFIYLFILILLWKIERLDSVWSCVRLLVNCLRLCGEKYRLILHWLIIASLSVWLVSKAIFKLNKSRSYKLWSLSRSRLVGSSLLSELLNWPWARTKLPLKLKYGKSFNRDIYIQLLLLLSTGPRRHFNSQTWLLIMINIKSTWVLSSVDDGSLQLLNFFLSSERSANL